jgi:hypothetical protein
MTGVASGPATWPAVRPRPRRRWIWVLVALATTACFVVPVTFRVALKSGLQHAYLPVVTYRQPITELDVQTDAGGSIMIKAGRAGQVSVDTTLSWLVRRPDVSRTWRRGVLDVAATCPKFNPFEDCGANITIGVPPGTAVRAAAGAGSVVVKGLTGPLHLSATAGQVLARQVSGPLWATATSGSVVAGQDVTSSRVYATVTTGQIALHLRNRPQELALAVGAGSASIALPPGSRYRIDSSVGGTLSVAPGLNDSRSDAVITISVATGAARIGYWQGGG